VRDGRTDRETITRPDHVRIKNTPFSVATNTDEFITSRLSDVICVMARRNRKRTIIVRAVRPGDATVDQNVGPVDKNAENEMRMFSGRERPMSEGD